LSADGYTIVIRHCELHDPRIAGLAKIFSETFRAPVDVHVYATPPGSFGFSWHYDAEDVFIFQCAGEKEYWLRKNTVNPWPLEETLPTDMRYEREIMPLMRVILRAGDLLYIPCGYWHRAQTTTCAETAISLAVGVMSRSAIDVFDLLRKEVLHSLVWRQRLPIPDESRSDDSDPTLDTLRHVLEQLAADASSTLKSKSFLNHVQEVFKI
jgi:ribosomal protein L16 Arg81 hydroxylase